MYIYKHILFIVIVLFIWRGFSCPVTFWLTSYLLSRHPRLVFFDVAALWRYQNMKSWHNCEIRKAAEAHHDGGRKQSNPRGIIYFVRIRNKKLVHGIGNITLSPINIKELATNLTVTRRHHNEDFFFSSWKVIQYWLLIN